jgi:hypothetical protein
MNAGKPKENSVPYKFTMGRMTNGPEHIIHYYGPATWAQDESWLYQDIPICWTISSDYRLLKL